MIQLCLAFCKELMLFACRKLRWHHRIAVEL